MHQLNHKTILLFLILSTSIHVHCSTTIHHARKLMFIQEGYKHNKQRVSPSFDKLILNELPKGKIVHSSSPSKSHASTTPTTLPDKELFGRHLAAIDRILRSVPSPGVGH
ncbi:hypothetical protein RND81_06G100800 [Saponaria officinalis]|uniref:Uncharacterized protein n=1 Tax=Saponaria officinalis TaxID=3572 RepID=A0AAW1K9E9_SAPOF